MIEIQKLQLLTLVAIADSFTFVEQGKKENLNAHICILASVQYLKKFKPKGQCDCQPTRISERGVSNGNLHVPLVIGLALKTKPINARTRNT